MIGILRWEKSILWEKFILPKPTIILFQIVWDENKKKWINTDEDPNDTSNEFKPPPKMADLMPKMPAAQPPGMGVVNTYTSSLDYSSMGVTNAHGSSLDYGSANFSSNQTVNNVPFNVDQNKMSSGPVSLPAMGAAAQKENVAPPKPAQSNMFKMQKNRSKLFV